MLTLAEAAIPLRCSKQTVRSWIRKGTLKYIKIGSRYYIDEDTIKELLTPTNANELTK